jgi:hypothetical protein
MILAVDSDDRMQIPVAMMMQFSEGETEGTLCLTHVVCESSDSNWLSVMNDKKW